MKCDTCGKETERTIVVKGKNVPFCSNCESLGDIGASAEIGQ